MKLVIGGAWQGKTKEACRIFEIKEAELADGRTCKMEEIYHCKGIHHFHEYVKRLLRGEWKTPENAKTDFPENLGEALALRNPDILIISDEIGYGIVPVDAFERLWREQTGRICCEIAARSSSVIRVTAGVGIAIKGMLP